MLEERYSEPAITPKVAMRKKSDQFLTFDLMKISAKITSGRNRQETLVQTNDTAKSIILPTKPSGFGSAVNGGELLLLALATCYCNDIYREAKRLQIPIEGIEVQAEADFEGIGLAASNIRYRARV